MSDWQVGDLALCVATEWRDPDPQYNGVGPKLGDVSEVDEILIDEGRVFLGLKAWPEDCFFAVQFRKIRPDEHEDCEPEFIELLKRSKAPTPDEREKRILEALFPRSQPTTQTLDRPKTVGEEDK